MSTPTPPGPGHPQAPGDNPKQPADPPPAAAAPVAPAAALTIEDFRSLRRWLLALGMIAVVALAVAVFAVSHASESAGSGRVASLERSVNRGLDDTNHRVDAQKSDAARADRRQHMDSAALDRRLRAVENNNVKAVKAAADTNRSLIALTARVDSLTQKANRRGK